MQIIFFLFLKTVLAYEAFLTSRYICVIVFLGFLSSHLENQRCHLTLIFKYVPLVGRENMFICSF